MNSLATEAARDWPDASEGQHQANDPEQWQKLRGEKSLEKQAERQEEETLRIVLEAGVPPCACQQLSSGKKGLSPFLAPPKMLPLLWGPHQLVLCVRASCLSLSGWTSLRPDRNHHTLSAIFQDHVSLIQGHSSRGGLSVTSQQAPEMQDSGRVFVCMQAAQCKPQYHTGSPEPCQE